MIARNVGNAFMHSVSLLHIEVPVTAWAFLSCFGKKGSKEADSERGSRPAPAGKLPLPKTPPRSTMVRLTFLGFKKCLLGDRIFGFDEMETEGFNFQLRNA